MIRYMYMYCMHAPYVRYEKRVNTYSKNLCLLYNTLICTYSSIEELCLWGCNALLNMKKRNMQKWEGEGNKKRRKEKNFEGSRTASRLGGRIYMKRGRIAQDEIGSVQYISKWRSII